jgi:ankyrin repeat protein
MSETASAVTEHAADRDRHSAGGGTPALRSALIVFALASATLAVFAIVERNVEEHAKLTRGLVVAVQNFDDEGVKRLLNKGADPNALVGGSPPGTLFDRLTRLVRGNRRESGDPVLLFASYFGHPKIVATLLKHGADPRVRAESGETPLHWAIINRDIDAARMLLDARADPNATESFGYTPVHIAATRNRLELMRLLLERGGNPNAANGSGTTPLMEAANNNDVEAARMLLDRGANAGLRDKNGQTALDHAKSALAEAKKISLRVKEAEELHALLMRYR